MKQRNMKLASAHYNAILYFVWLNSKSSFETLLHGIEEEDRCQGVKEYWVALLARPDAIQDTCSSFVLLFDIVWSIE